VPAERPTRAAYPHFERATTRWSDVDMYGHLNNATYFELIDTAISRQLELAVGTDLRSLPAIGVVAEVSCRYFAEVSYPEPVDLGVVVERVGRSSVVYRVGLFQGDEDGARAEGRYVHVYVDHADPARPVVPVPDVVRAAIGPLLAR
jgi:acyl-CoA thioester hydrolase